MNPFSGYGSVVEPSRFIGRQQEVAMIRERVLSEGYGSVAIIGETRIGKTSLMNYPFEQNKALLQKQGKIIVNVGDIARFKCDEPDQFFIYLINQAHKQLKKHQLYSLEELFSTIISSSNFVTEGLFDYLELVKESGYRLIFLLDEFDGVQNIFSNSPAAFHTLRTMGDDFRWKVSFVITSRIGVGQIEQGCTGISTFASIFQDIPLNLMSETEIRTLIDSRLQNSKIKFTEGEIEKILQTAGYHPFFVEMFSFYLYQTKVNKLVNQEGFKETERRVRNEFFRYFDNYRERLGSVKFSELLRIIYDNEDQGLAKSELINLGHLIELQDEKATVRVRPFSRIYNEYLSLQYLKTKEKATNKPETIQQTTEQDKSHKFTITILFLAANPTDVARLRLGTEFREIQEKLQLATMRDKFVIEQRTSVRVADITQALLTVEPTIVHFAGHGTDAGGLCLEDESGKLHIVQPDALAALFKLVSNHVECVLLNACFTELQATAIAEHVAYVIGMRQAVGDEAAIAFAVGFYQALGAGRSIEDAYEFGCVQTLLRGFSEELAPILVKPEKAKLASAN